MRESWSCVTGGGVRDSVTETRWLNVARRNSVAKKKAGLRHAVKNQAGAAGRRGPAGPPGPPGPAGPAGPRITSVEILALVDGQFTEIRRQLDVQLRRIAQMQHQLDEVQMLVKSAVTQLQE